MDNENNTMNEANKYDPFLKKYVELGYLEIPCAEGQGDPIKVYNGSDWLPGDRTREACPALKYVSRVRGYVRDNGAVLASLTTCTTCESTSE